MFANEKHKEFELLVDYLYTTGHLSAQALKNKAESGNAWAMAYYAVSCIEKNDIDEARIWAKESIDAGSVYGKFVLTQIGKYEKARTSYYTFGSKKELISMGFLDKNGISLGAFINKEYATKIDNEKVFEIRLYSRRAKLISSHPLGTYNLLKNGLGQYVLKITQPKLFWKDSDLLVIQTD